MGGEQVTPESIRKAVVLLKQYNLVDSMMTAYFSAVMFNQLENWNVINADDHPDWIQKLEKEWGIR